MRSAQPKVLHTLAGAPLLQHVLATATALQPRNLVVVVGHQGEQVQAYLSQCAPQAQSVWQRPPQGTGHAVQQAVPQLANDGVVLVLSGDVPLMTWAIFKPCARWHNKARWRCSRSTCPSPPGTAASCVKNKPWWGLWKKKTPPTPNAN